MFPQLIFSFFTRLVCSDTLRGANLLPLSSADTLWLLPLEKRNSCMDRAYVAINEITASSPFFMKSINGSSVRLFEKFIFFLPLQVIVYWGCSVSEWRRVVSLQSPLPFPLFCLSFRPIISNEVAIASNHMKWCPAGFSRWLKEWGGKSGMDAPCDLHPSWASARLLAEDVAKQWRRAAP